MLSMIPPMYGMQQQPQQQPMSPMNFAPGMPQQNGMYPLSFALATQGGMGGHMPMAQAPGAPQQPPGVGAAVGQGLTNGMDQMQKMQQLMKLFGNQQGQQPLMPGQQPGMAPLNSDQVGAATAPNGLFGGPV